MQSKLSLVWVDRAIIAVLLVMGIMMLLPFLWLFSMSFRPVAEAYKMPPIFLPQNLDFTIYQSLLNSSMPFLRSY